MSFLRDHGDEFFHIVDKSHIEHAVSFIKDKYLDIGESHMSLRYEVKESTRSRDQDIDSLSHTRDLSTLSYSSEDDR